MEDSSSSLNESKGEKVSQGIEKQILVEREKEDQGIEEEILSEGIVFGKLDETEKEIAQLMEVGWSFVKPNLKIIGDTSSSLLKRNLNNTSIDLGI